MSLSRRENDVPNTGSLAEARGVKEDLLQRLRTAGGHLNAVTRMVHEEADCIDILKQIAAVQAALTKVAYGLSEAHMKHCVRRAIALGEGEARVDELLETLKILRRF